MNGMTKLRGYLRSLGTRLQGISSHRAVKAVATLSTGSVISQVLGLITVPVIARLYGPEQVGLFGIFQGWVTVLVPLAGLCLPMAIVVPRSDQEAGALVKASLFASLCVAAVALMGVTIGGDRLLLSLNAEPLKQMVWLVPVFVLLSTAVQCSRYLLLRSSAYGGMAMAGVTQSVVANGAKVVLGVANPAAAGSLVLGQSIGDVSHLLVAYLRNKAIFDAVRAHEAAKGVWLAVVNHRDFVLYRAPQAFVNNIGQSAPAFLLAALFSTKQSGFYAMSVAILGAPAMLLGRAIGDVVYQHGASRDNPRAMVDLLKKSTKGSLLVALVIFPLIALIAPWGLPLLFGEGWDGVGAYVSLMAIAQISHFATRPAVAMIPLLGIQGWLLAFEVFSALLRASALYIGAVLFHSHYWAVGLFSFSSLIIYFGIYAKASAVAQGRSL